MNLPEPDFIPRDPQAITAEIIAEYEAASGKKLYPAQVDRLLIDIIAYRESLLRIGIQEAAKQNLVAFARAPMLDYLGQLVGIFRLPAQPATTVLRFSVEAALDNNLLIPVRTRVDGGSVIFATDEDVILLAGDLFIDVPATCEETGEVGNNWQPGQINNLVDDLGVDDLSVVNISVTANGADQEDDERLRLRIELAPESFSTAGPREAYRSLVLGAHQNIVDVGVLEPELALENGKLVSKNDVPPGCVFVFPLMKTGLPDEKILALAKAACSGKKERPLTDFVVMAAPTPIDYRIEAELELYENTDADSTKAASELKAKAYSEERAVLLGKDIIPAQISKALLVDGVYNLALKSPPDLVVLAGNEWARCTGISVTIKRLVND